MGADILARGMAAIALRAGLSGNGRTVAVSTPLLNLTQGWSGTATFTLDFANVTADPGPSSTASLLIDRQYLGVSKFNVTRAGNLSVAGALQANTDAGTFKLGASLDVILARDAANTLALRNGGNPQQANVYRTFTDSSNYERLQIGADLSGLGANTFGVYTASAGTGASTNPLYVGTAGAAIVGIVTSGTTRWQFNSSGHILAQADNTYDIGASGANRPRNLYLSQNVGVGGYVLPGLFTVATLPAAATGLKGARATVSDANASTFNSTVAAGGANIVPVFCDGSVWKIG